MTVIEIRNLKKYFSKIKAIDDISLSVNQGEIFGYLGPNGAGKTTTISAMMGFISPTDGTIKVFGKDINTYKDVLKSEIGYLSSDVHLYENLTANDHFKLIEGIRGKSNNLTQLKEDFKFDFNQKVHHLSTGTKQKLGVILCLMVDPRVLILDEPTRGLDPLLQNKFYEYLFSFKKKGTTIFMSSHNLSEVEKLCDRIGIIKAGKLLAVETITSLQDKRIHIVKTKFTEQIDLNVFKVDGVENVNVNQQGEFTLKVKGAIDPVIKLISQYNLIDIEVNPASLEDIFMEFYE